MDSAGLRDFYAMFSIAVFAISIYAASRFYYASARRTGLDRELFRALLAVMTIGIANAAWDVVRFTGLVAISDPELDRLPARPHPPVLRGNVLRGERGGKNLPAWPAMSTVRLPED